MYRNDPDSTNRTSLTLIIAFVAAVIIFIADQNSGRFLQRSKSLTDTTVTPALSLLSTPVRATEDFFSGLRDRRRAHEENILLKEELYQLREAKDRADILELKLFRLEQILKANIGSDIPKEKIAARAVSEIDGPFVRGALINAGKIKGVEVGHPVMTVEGMYGHVVKVGINSARVLRLGDLNSRIAIMSFENEATAILSGNNSDFPEISFISDKGDWKTGDVVVTSGDDGVLPRGLPIGIVRRGTKSDLNVELYVTNSPVDWVWVYPFKPIPTPEENEGVIASDDTPNIDDPEAPSSSAE